MRNRSSLAIGVLLVCFASAAHAERPATPYVSESASIDGFEAKFIDVKGVRTRYYDEGAGEPLVLVHGGGGPTEGGYSANANLWTPVLGRLAKRFRVLAPDKLGAGMTDDPKDLNDFTIAGEIQHIHDFIETLGLKQVHLVGQSRGGGLAFLLAVQHPQLVKTLIIVNSSTASPPAGDDRTRRRERVFSVCQRSEARDDSICGIEALSYQTDVPYNASLAASTAFLAKWNKEKGRRAPRTREMWQRSDQLTSRMNAEAYLRIRLEGVLQMPTLLYWSMNDPSVLPQQAISLFNIIADTNPRARLLFTNKAGHFHWREEPEEFSHTVMSFIDYWNEALKGVEIKPPAEIFRPAS
ncbi:MAG TPA: alpha/beta hydrolase [Steroidobacteraceae bacterium]